MTEPTKHRPSLAHEGQSSLLAPADMSLRVSPAQFSRMLSVSKQCVSQWIRSGKVTLGPDGRLDPVVGTRQVLENSDPGRLRAKVLRPLVDDAAAMRQQISDRDMLIAELRESVAYLDNFLREYDCSHERLLGEIETRWEHLRTLGPDEIAATLRALDGDAILACGDEVDTDDAGVVDADTLDLELADLVATTDKQFDAMMQADAAVEEQGGGRCTALLKFK